MADPELERRTRSVQASVNNALRQTGRTYKDGYIAEDGDFGDETMGAVQEMANHLIVEHRNLKGCRGDVETLRESYLSTKKLADEAERDLQKCEAKYQALSEAAEVDRKTLEQIMIIAAALKQQVKVLERIAVAVEQVT